jgi:hypothetical protein
MFPILITLLLNCFALKVLIVNVGQQRSFTNHRESFTRVLVNPIKQYAQTDIVFCTDRELTFANASIYVSLHHSQFSRFQDCLAYIKQNYNLSDYDYIIKTRPDMEYYAIPSLLDLNASNIYVRIRDIKYLPPHLHNFSFLSNHFSYRAICASTVGSGLMLDDQFVIMSPPLLKYTFEIMIKQDIGLKPI